MFTELTMNEQIRLYETLRDGHRKYDRLMNFMILAQVNDRMWRSVADASSELLDVMGDLTGTPYADSRP